MPAIATLCGGCHHPEEEHHIKKESWLECFHPGCNCESYKGFAYWNERDNTVDVDHSARLAEGQRRWGSENAKYTQTQVTKRAKDLRKGFPADTGDMIYHELVISFPGLDREMGRIAIDEAMEEGGIA